MSLPVINTSGSALPRGEAVNYAASATIEIQPSNAATVTNLEFYQQLNTYQWAARYNLDVQPGYIPIEVEVEYHRFHFLDVAGYGAMPVYEKAFLTSTYAQNGYNYVDQRVWYNGSTTTTGGHVATCFFKAFWRRGVASSVNVFGPYNAYQGGYTPNRGYPGVSSSDTYDEFEIMSRLRIKYAYMPPGPLLRDSAGRLIVINGKLVRQG